MAGQLAIDTETTGLHFWAPLASWCVPARPFLVSVASVNNPNKTDVYSCTSVNPYDRQVTWSPATLQAVTDKINNATELVFFNAVFDLCALLSVDYPPLTSSLWAHLFRGSIHDGLVAAHVCDSDSFVKDLKTLSHAYLGVPDDDQQSLKRDVLASRTIARKRAATDPTYKNYTSENLPYFPVDADYWLPAHLRQSESATKYAALDATRTALIHRMFQRVMRGDSARNRVYQDELQLVPITLQMAEVGLRIRPKVSENEYRRVLDRATRVGRQLCVQAQVCTGDDYNPNSPTQTARVLSRLGATVVERTPTGQVSTTKEVLQEMLDLSQSKQLTRFITCYLEYTNLTKALEAITTYKKFTSEDSRIHSIAKQVGTRSTRYSSSKPNLQNVSKRPDTYPLRKLFGPDNRHRWYAIDYDQLEIRLIAHSSEDPAYKAFLSEGKDQHQYTADLFDVPRVRAKTINFAWQYGAGNRKLGILAGTDPSDFARKMKEGYPGIIALQERLKREAKKNKQIRTLFGRPLTLRSDFRKATNRHVQGTAGELVKLAMIQVYQYIQDNVLPITFVLNIHDELLFECPADFDRRHRNIRKIASIMADQGKQIGCHTPVSISVIPPGRGWNDSHTIRQ